jgi:uncharacterized phage protein gp47/JayE
VAHLNGRPSDRFVTTVEVPADPTGGDFDVLFEAETVGTLQVDIGQLNTIAEPVSGWTAVTNASAGDPGSEPETDDELRLKRERELEAAGSANLDAIIANVSNVDGVIDVSGIDNVKHYYVNGLPPKSIRITVRGGSDDDVAEAIFDTKSAGIDTIGDTTINVVDSQGQNQPINFVRGSALTFYAEATLQVSALWNPPDDLDAAKARVSAYINSLGLGDDVIYDRVLCALYDAEEKIEKVLTLTIGFAPSPVGTSDLSVSDENYATSDVANLDITVP